MRSVFVDSGGFFALLVAEDAFHERARALFSRADAEGWQLMTTNAVVVETYSLLLVRTRERRAKAIQLLDALGASRCRIERVRRSDEVRAETLVRAHADKTYSLCDALSFSVMERVGVREAVAFDRHFRAYGRFRLL